MSLIEALLLKLKESAGYVPIIEACIIGFVAGGSSVLLSMGVTALGAWRVQISEGASPTIFLSAFGLAGGLVAGFLVDKVAPEASGSGIPQVKAWLDRVMMALDFRVALVKLMGGIVALGCGLFLGREGPTVQVGAAVANPISRWLPTTAAHKRQLIAAGAGAGLAAAFNAPLAGVVFVLEELLKEIRPSTIVLTTIACAVASLVLNTFWPPHQRSIVEPLMQAISFKSPELPFYLLLGILSGLCGAAFNAGILGALNFNKKVLRLPTALRVGLAGMVSGAVISLLPISFHDYAGMRALIIAGEPNTNVVVAAFFIYSLLTFLAYGSGAPGGLFAPSLALGAALGHMVGVLERTICGTDATVTFALVGMGAFFSAVGRVPLTAIVITFEMTTNFTLLTPLMLTCILSAAVAELVFKGGLYEHLMRWNKINLQGPGTSKSGQLLLAKDILRTSYESFDGSTLVREVLSQIGGSHQRGFPVLQHGKLVGVLTQTDLSKLNDIDDFGRMTIAEIMTPHPVAVSLLDNLDDILFLFSRHKFSWLPVTTDDKLQGIITQGDVINALFTEEERTATLKHHQIENPEEEKNDSENSSALEEKEKSKPSSDQGE